MSACVCVRKDENHFETISHKGMYVRVWVFVVKKASALSTFIKFVQIFRLTSFKRH